MTAKEKKQRFYERKLDWRKYKSNTAYVRSVGSTVLHGILIYIFFALLLICILRVSRGQAPFSFYGFLETISNNPAIQIPFLSPFSSTVVSDWGIFNFVKSVLDFFTYGINATVFILNGIMSIFTWIVWAFNLLFV